jgi:hypothetical protein
MSPEEKLLAMNRESFRYFERNHFFLEITQRLELVRVCERSANYEQTKCRLHAVLKRVLREFPSRANATDEDLAHEIVAHSGMMKEILHSLPRPWPEDLLERVTRLFLYGVNAHHRKRRTQPAKAHAGALSVISTRK